MPRIYVADLAAYNAGRLVGEWIDLSEFDDVDDLTTKVETDILRKAKTGHEEWAIDDYEGFGGIRVGEYDSLETVLSHAQRLGDEPGKYVAWINARGESDAENFDPDCVHGPYESESAYVDDYIENCFGDLDLETVLVNAGADKPTAEALSQMLEWRDADALLRDWGNPLVSVSNGDYSVEFYEVSE